MKRKILYLGNKLAAKGFTPTGIDTLGPLLEGEGFTVIYASSKKSKILRFLEMILTLIKSRKRVDYVLIDTYSTANFWYAYAAGRLCHFFNLKYIPILHGGDLPKRLTKSSKTSRFLFKNSWVNCAPSSYLKTEFEYAGFTNVEIIPNAIDLEQYSFKSNRDPEFPKILWVRSFASIYNPFLALKLVEELVRIYPKTQLTMVGPDKDGSLEACRQYAARHNLPVEFTGKLSKQDWVARSEDFNVFLNTTNHDNTPVSLIEAMALGLPVFSTRVGGIPYLIQHQKTGFLYESNKVSELFDLMIETFSKPELLSKVTLEARIQVESYNWPHVKQLWLKLLN